ncbi:hypothetical protein F2P79_007515 [Pimephales promelas]|nr:hypothetical protein F2P79_007515 [Pimephales promelas]
MYSFSMNSCDWSQSSYIPPPQIGLNSGPPMAQNDLTTPPYPPPPYPLQDCRDEVESVALPRSDAIETHCGVIRPENLIWDPSNLKELGPLTFVGVYNLPPAFWPAVTEQGEDKRELSLSAGVTEAAATDSEELLPYFTGSRKRKRAIYSGNEFSPAAVERFEMHDDFELSEPPHSKPRLDSCVEDVLSLCHGSDVDGTNRADDSINIKNSSSFVPYDTTDLLEDFDFLTPSHQANEIISGLSVDEYGQTEIAAVTEQGEDKHELSAATDSEELLSYFTGSRKRKRAIYSGNEFSPAAAERLEMHEDFELSDLHLDSFESIEDLYHYIFSDESTAFYD